MTDPGFKLPWTQELWDSLKVGDYVFHIASKAFLRINWAYCGGIKCAGLSQDCLFNPDNSGLLAPVDYPYYAEKLKRIQATLVEDLDFIKRTGYEKRRGICQHLTKWKCDLEMNAVSPDGWYRRINPVNGELEILVNEGWRKTDENGN